MISHPMLQVQVSFFKTYQYWFCCPRPAPKATPHSIRHVHVDHQVKRFSTEWHLAKTTVGLKPPGMRPEERAVRKGAFVQCEDGAASAGSRARSSRKEGSNVFARMEAAARTMKFVVGVLDRQRRDMHCKRKLKQKKLDQKHVREWMHYANRC